MVGGGGWGNGLAPQLWKPGFLCRGSYGTVAGGPVQGPGQHWAQGPRSRPIKLPEDGCRGPRPGVAARTDPSRDLCSHPSMACGSSAAPLTPTSRTPGLWPMNFVPAGRRPHQGLCRGPCTQLFCPSHSLSSGFFTGVWGPTITSGSFVRGVVASVRDRLGPDPAGQSCSEGLVGTSRPAGVGGVGGVAGGCRRQDPEGCPGNSQLGRERLGWK